MLHHNSLPFNPANIYNTYGVSINYRHSESTIHYEIDCHFQKYLNTEAYLVSLNRKQVFINNELPANKLHQLAAEMAQSIYPVTLRLCKSHGQTDITDIFNYQEITGRAQAARQRLSRYFGGSGAQACLSLFEKHCSNPNNIINALSDDLFYKLFFFSLHTMYSPQLTAEIAIKLTFNSKKIHFITTCQLASCYNEHQKLIVDVYGISMEHAGAGFSARYQLYAEDHTIASVTGTITYPWNDDDYGKMEFEIYHLNPEKRKINQATSFIRNAKNSAVNPQSAAVEAPTVPLGPRSKWNLFD